MTEAAISPAHVHTKEQTAQETVAATEALEPTFPDVVWAHFQWDTQRRHPPEDGKLDPTLEQRYRQALKAFEEEHGPIVNVYWSQTDASAVAVTVKPTGRLHFDEMRFHRVTDWVTRSTPAIPDALNRCETLAMKAQEVLRGTSEQITIQWLYSVASHLLGFIERSGGKPHEAQAEHAAKDAQAELQKLEAYYDLAGMKAGRIVYTGGMVIGAVGLLALGIITALVLWIFTAFESPSIGIETFFACYAAGALGAIVSVMARMASARNEWIVDYEVGRPALRFLGGARPVVGAIFGLAMYFIVKAGLLQIAPTSKENSFYWYTSLAFLAGFSERFTKVLGDSADKVMAGGGKLNAHASSAGTVTPPPPPSSNPPSQEAPTAAEGV
jgi:hypothetical protein